MHALYLFLIIGFVASLFGFQPAIAYAARFELIRQTVTLDGMSRPVLDSFGPPCHVRLTGDIVEGDLDRLRSVFRRLDKNQLKGICLNSRGGSYAEALRIAAAMLGKGQNANDWGIPLESAWTVVEAGAECLSACAIIFMAGNQYTDEEGFGAVISRHLHARGTLGFHSPFLFDLEDKSFSDRDVSFTLRQVEETFRAGVKAVRELADLGKGVNQGGRRSDPNVMPLRLIVEMLARGPREFFLIDNVHKAIRYKIDVLGVSLPKRITKRELDNLCVNQLYKEEESTEFLESMRDDQRKWNTVRRKASTLLFADAHGGEAASYCVIKIPTTTSAAPSIYNNLVDDREFLPDYNFINPTPVFFYPPAARLVDLPNSSMRYTLPEISNSAMQTGPTETPTFVIHDSRDVPGNDLRIIKNIGSEQCAEACRSTALCQAYSFDKWNRWCFLKSQMSALRLEPNSITGIRRGLPTPPDAIGTVVMQRLRGKHFPDGGHTYRTASSVPACERACKRNRDCVAYTFYRNTRSCRLFSSTGEYFSHRSADSGVKRQVAQ